MLRWALGYLAMAVVVAIGFAALEHSAPPERQGVSAAARQSTRDAGSRRAYEEEAESESAWEDDSTGYNEGYPQDEGYPQEEGYPQDDGYPQDEGYSDDQSDFEYVIQAGAGGHFLVEAVVNGTPVTFLVDTGASNVVLSMADAERIGFRPETLRFTQRFASANGEVRGAPVVLRELRVGQFSLLDMPASVNEAPLRVSLLGMSFLKRLHGYSVEDGRLILRW